MSDNQTTSKGSRGSSKNPSSGEKQSKKEETQSTLKTEKDKEKDKEATKDTKDSSKENKDAKESKDKKKSTTQNLKITEWRFSEFLGEKIPLINFKTNPENESFLVTSCKFSNNGDYQIITDKGGRIIIFKKKDRRSNGPPKLEYYYEYAGHEKDFDNKMSFEYSEEIKSLSIFPISDYNKVDIITASYRNIHIDRVYQKHTKVYDKPDKKNVDIPRLKHTKNEIKHKTLLNFNRIHTSEINSVSLSNLNVENFISSDESKLFLWDINQSKEVFNIINLEESKDEDNEKITTSSFSPYHASLFAYGTNKGNLRYCDLRVSSKHDSFVTNYRDENSNLSKTIFANQLLSVHDINFKLSNEYLMATRHYLSVNLWDQRKNSEPLFKFLLYEPIINKLSYLYQNDYFKDKFSICNDPEGKFILTGGYNNMFHVLDVEQKLNSQIVLDDTNEKSLNTNIIRKVNSKGSCFYKKDEPELNNINFDKKITSVALSPVENFAMLACLNCIYTYNGCSSKSKS